MGLKGILGKSKRYVLNYRYKNSMVCLLNYENMICVWNVCKDAMGVGEEEVGEVG